MKHKAPKPWGLIFTLIIGLVLVVWVLAALWFGGEVGVWNE